MRRDVRKSLQLDPDSSVDWLALVTMIKANDSKGISVLRQVFFQGIRFFLGRRLGLHQLEQRAEETFTILTNSIRTAELLNLVTLVRVVVLDQIAAYSAADVQKRSQPQAVSSGIILDHSVHPDRKSIQLESTELMFGVLGHMSVRNQEALTRFYLNKQTQEQLCQEMQLSEAEFLLLKSGIKASFAEGLLGISGEGDATGEDPSGPSLSTAVD